MTAATRTSDRRGLVAAAALAAGAGLAWALVMPRGPVTTPQAIGSIVMATLLGVAVGLVSGRRIGAVIAVSAFAVAFDIVRVLGLGITGPTVDRVDLGSTYGLLAFVLGRGVGALLLLAPIVLGALLGVESAARLGHPRATRLGVPGRLVAGLGAVGLAGLVLLLAGGGSTPPIIGPDGDPLPGSIAEVARLPIGGHDQTVMIRGRSVDSPVLLYLAGGPGGTDLGAMRSDVGLEQDFIVVTWEQRGAGKSYDALDPVGTLTVGSMVDDTIELADHLRERFDEDRIYLVGSSWGSILGVLAAQRAPDRFHAVVGTGQMVSPRETDRLFWEDTLAWAEAVGDEDLAATLRRNGPPPYDDLLAYEPAITHEHDVNPYPDLDLDGEMPAILFVPEYDLMDRVNGLRSLLDTFAVLYPQLQETDLRQDATSLEVPYYMVIGAHEARGRAILADDWFELLEAPSKERFVFERSGHRPQFEEPGGFAELMRGVLADTQ